MDGDDDYHQSLIRLLVHTRLLYLYLFSLSLRVVVHHTTRLVRIEERLATTTNLVRS